MSGRYPAYKPSGVEWLGEVPEGWGVVPIKTAFDIIGGTTPKSDVPEYWDGNINWATPADLSNLASRFICETGRKITEAGLASCGTSVVPSGSIILSVRAPIGSLAIAAYAVCTNQGCKALVAKSQADSTFYFFVIESARAALNVLGRGSTFLELSGDQLASFRVPLPPLPEQIAIAAFLDVETGKIDALVAQQRRLIDLLREKRQAVISHAVTRGLNPEAPLKPSGIDWLADVPEGWEVVRLRNVSRMNPSKQEVATIPKDTEVSFLPMEAVGEDGSLDLSKRRVLEEVENGYTYFRDGDVTYAKITPCFENGKGALMTGLDNGFGFGTTELTVMRPDQTKILPEYLYSLVSSPDFLNIGEGFMYGAGGQKRVPDDFARDFQIALPPILEQTEIVRHIVSMKAQFDTLTATAETAIALLQERRAALISAAVTGKIDVRALAPQTTSPPTQTQGGGA